MMDSENTFLKKSRVIPKNDFYTRLQLEYISYKMRLLLYEREEDKKKFQDICVKKREKIELIALKDCLPSIFTSPESQKKYLDLFFGQGKGIPNFCYRDDYQKRVKGYWDSYYYFRKGSLVQFKHHNDDLTGIVLYFHVPSHQVTILMPEGTKYKKHCEELIKVFPEDFFLQLFK